MSATKITTHVQDGVARLHSIDKDQPNTVAILSGLLAPVQDTENALWQLLVERGVDTAVGVQLDTLGAIVGQPRNGLSDDVYRRYIRARIRTNTSAGVGADLIHIARLVIGDLEAEIIIEPQYPAALVVRLPAGTSDEVATVVSVLLQQAKSAGVRLVLEFSESPAEDTFAFAPVVAFLTATYTPGGLTYTVDSTAGFAPSGQLIIDRGTVVEQVRTYSAITATTFSVNSSLTGHAIGAAIVPNDSPTNGWGDSTDPDVGGVHAGAKG